MNYFLKGLILLFVMAFVASCQEEQYDDVAFTANYAAEMQVAVDTSLNHTFSSKAYFIDTVSIDPAKNEHFNEYSDKINNIEIMEFMGKIITMNQSTTIEDVFLRVYSGSESVSWTIGKMELYQGKSLKFADQGGEWHRVADILRTNKLCNIIFSGTTNSTNVSFTMQLKLDADITANPL